MTRCENARLGVGTTTRYDRTARSRTNHRYRSCWHQRHMARPDVCTLEGCQQGGPETGSSSEAIEYLGMFWTILGCRLDRKSRRLNSRHYCATRMPPST